MGASIKTGLAGHSRRRGRRKHAAMSEINVTPFVDVMLVLLIIFMVAAPMLVVGVPLELQKTASSDQIGSSPQPLTISVAADGKIFLGETPIDMAEVAAKLKANAKNGLETEVWIRGDKSSNYGLVLRVMDVARGAGFKKFKLLTESGSGT